MIVFKYCDIERPFEFEPGRIYDLVIENPAFLYRFVNDLRECEEEALFFSKEGLLLDAKNQYVIVTDPYVADANAKKSLSLIYKNSEKRYLNEVRRERLLSIGEEITSFLTEISFDFDMPMVFKEEITLADILDMCDFRVSTDFSTMESRILSLLKMIREISQTKFVFIVGFLDMIEAQRMDAFLAEVAYLDMTLVNISSRTSNHRKDRIITYVIDDNLCEF